MKANPNKPNFKRDDRVFYKEAHRKEECRIAKKIAAYGTPLRNFGSSDCDCKSHLFKINNDKIDWAVIGMELMQPCVTK